MATGFRIPPGAARGQELCPWTCGAGYAPAAPDVFVANRRKVPTDSTSSPHNFTGCQRASEFRRESSPGVNGRRSLTRRPSAFLGPRSAALSPKSPVGCLGIPSEPWYGPLARCLRGGGASPGVRSSTQRSGVPATVGRPQGSEIMASNLWRLPSYVCSDHYPLPVSVLIFVALATGGHRPQNGTRLTGAHSTSW